MSRSMTRPLERLLSQLVVAAALSGSLIASGVVAQTLVDPNPRPAPSPPPAVAKPQPPGQAKSCAIYGEGFVKLPGSDACVKIGGYVRVEGGR